MDPKHVEIIMSFKISVKSTGDLYGLCNCNWVLRTATTVSLSMTREDDHNSEFYHKRLKSVDCTEHYHNNKAASLFHI